MASSALHTVKAANEATNKLLRMTVILPSLSIPFRAAPAEDR